MKSPEHFNKTAINYFNFVVAELEKIDRLNATDQPIIERLAFSLATVETCEKELLQDGLTVMGPHGKKGTSSRFNFLEITKQDFGKF
ncbi:hypothetical protein CMV16_08100 [Peribacillus simplex]|nr:hypothetical protein CMV16_08100 [Peribacillus simplex]